MARRRGISAKSLLMSVAAVGGLSFYVAWPAYSGYQIRGALEERDAAALSAKVDFASVRASLRPAVATKVEQEMARVLRKAGPAGGLLTDEIKARYMPQIVDAVLTVLVTPEMLIRIHAQGKNIKEAIEGLVAEKAQQPETLSELIGVPGGAGGAGGAGGGFGKLGEMAEKLGIDPGKVIGGFGTKKAAEPETKPAAEPQELAGSNGKRRYGLDNIKHFGLNGPLGLAVGVARDPNARKPDVTAEMTFVDGTWKLTGLVPGI